MLNIVLVEPEIPQNTGNIARTCACIGARLHVVEPAGFRITERNLRRAGCDYWNDVEMHLFTGHVNTMFGEVTYSDECYLVFGRESRGLDERWMERFASACVRIPMRDGMRSLNLSNAVAIAAFEALRQIGYPYLQ